ncbi:CRISPR-associated endonuclease Cas2 [candidate division Kazan bacterium]|uniref:CRISPR-associated endonuclease Cas2 n=1 Tax=candidate division Kazan bacterium TaxID=2202143 RepID=A0A420ZD84_UNCK3|nr:MAG: CRISPR-associated endonuclease Cas2 [candidate division Kazan bacterium]
MKNNLQSVNKSVVREVIVRLFKTSVVETADLLGLILETKYKGFQLLKKGELRRKVSELIKNGEIKKQGENKYQLTKYGVVRALPAIKKILAKDGQTRVLVFDIPESKRKLRDSFRSHIKTLGFKKHQQSVWVSEYDCENWMLKIIDYHKVGNYTSLYIGKHIW